MTGISVNIGGHNFQAPEKVWMMGEQFLGRYLKFPKPIGEYDHYELKNICLLGTMGSGKSTQIKAIMKYIKDAFPGEVNYFSSDSVDMAITHADLRPMQVWCIDDAASQNDSRMSGGKTRASQTQMFFVVRHNMLDHARADREMVIKDIDEEIEEKKSDIISRFTEEVSKLQETKETLSKKKLGGIIFIIWSFQFYSSIDTRYRNFFDVIFIKSYSDDSSIKMLLNNNSEILEVLKDITRENLFNNYEVRNIAVGATRAKDILILKTPYIKDEDFPIPYFSGESLRETYINSLYQDLLKKPMSLLCAKKEVLYGYFHTTFKDDREYNKWHIGKVEINMMLEDMAYEKKDEIAFYKEMGVDPQSVQLDQIVKSPQIIHLDDIIKNKTTKMELVERLRKYDISFRLIGKMFKENHSNIYSQFRKWMEEKEHLSQLGEELRLTEFDYTFQNLAGWKTAFRIQQLMGFSLTELAKKIGCSEDWVEFWYEKVSPTFDPVVESEE